ncbi:redoxin domain-containing protein [Shewanella sp. VB17]|uniref:TlpA family protein disulfide reductase n=1 Tax=Shewanella sp. VB17 TaxID=2739432 RepID=UPI001564C041|nr:TlpA disulfide reductase family protein [Shewanella sp. VB17]NRD73432.1 redoxin domain-containing protein [Shewanella sp. VB17]
MFKKYMFIVSLLFVGQMFSTPALGYQQGELLSSKALQKLDLNPNELTIIDFFAQWCVSCRVELPEVEILSRQLIGRGVNIVGVDVDEDVDVGLAFQQELGLTFRVVADPDQELVTDFEPTGMPALYYVYQGKVLKVRYGAIDHIRQVMITDIKSLDLSGTKDDK